jgi:hypothetical protein
VPFTSGFLRADALSLTGDGVEVEVRLPWMRSLPWRCVDRFTVSFDGRRLRRSDLRVRIGDSVIHADDCPTVDGYWVVGTPVVLLASRTPEPMADQRVCVRVGVTFVIPYVAGHDGPVAFTATGEEQLVPLGSRR